MRNLRKRPSFIVLGLLALIPSGLVGASDFYDSGLIKRFELPKKLSRNEIISEDEASFIARYFSGLNPRFSWKRVNSYGNMSRIHSLYGLQLDGYRYFGEYLKIHRQDQGPVEYATNTFDGKDWDYTPVANLTHYIEQSRRSLSQKFSFHRRPFKGKIEIEPVIYAPKPGKAQLLLEAKVEGKDPIFFKHYLLRPENQSIVEEFRVIREAARDVYAIHPDRSSLGTIASFPNITGSTLSDSRLHVYRDENADDPQRKDIDPTTDFTSSFNTSPSDYDYTCTGATSACPDQGFNGVNVYYHLDSYRNNVDAYFSALGVSPDLDLDPLNVVVNTLSVDLDGDGDGSDEANNAFYASTLSGFTGGLFFLRPQAGRATVCGSSTIQFYDLAREALVIVHEYQHYLTDKITGLVAGSVNNPNVGDALHEGYSDYFAASQVTFIAGSQVTLVGEYAFKECSAIQREIGTLTPLDDSDSDFSDPHLSGLTFASGLWQLRTELGREAADKLAYLSLFYQSARPGYLDAVEAIVQADNVLNGGIHASRIRELFYDTLKFTGGIPTGAFRNIDETVVELGFNSCAIAPVFGSVPHISFLLIAAWLQILLVVGRLSQKRKKRQ